MAYVPPERLADLDSDCIGRAIPGVELEVVDERGERVAGNVGAYVVFEIQQAIGR